MDPCCRHGVYENLMKYTLLTGATGLLGRYLLRDLIRQEIPVVALVRPTRQLTAKQRIDAVLADFERNGSLLTRPVVLAGDLSKEQLGLSPSNLDWLKRNCDSVVHSAASLSFREQDGEPHATNVVATRRLLAVCEAANIRIFRHVSTAYVCGLRTGRVFEDELDVGQDFGNPYEETKVAAEKLVRAAALDAYTVFRPAIIVGDSETGFSSTFHGLYTPLRVLSAMSDYVSLDDLFASAWVSSLGLTGTEGKNFVPVDWVSDAMVSILQRGKDENRTYNIASSSPVTVNRFYAAYERSIRNVVTRETRCRAESSGKTSLDSPELKSLVATYTDSMSAYQSYWRDDPEFDTSNTERVLPDKPAPDLTDEQLDRLCNFALGTNFQWTPEVRELRKSTVQDLASQWTQIGLGEYGGTLQADQAIVLTVAGRGGGQWTIRRDQGHVRAEMGKTTDSPTCELRLNSLVADRILAGVLRTEDALQRGGVLVIGWQGGAALLSELLEGVSPAVVQA